MFGNVLLGFALTEAVALYFRARIAAYLGDSEAAFTLFERIIEAAFAHAKRTGKTSVTVKLARVHGYEGEVAIEVEGLPEGLSVPADLVIPAGKNELKFELSATADCSVTTAYVRVVGAGQRGDSTVTRVAMTGVEQVTSVLLTSIISKSPITIAWVLRETQHERPRGSTFPAELEIKRQEGYQGEIWLMPHSSRSSLSMAISNSTIFTPSRSKVFM